MRLERFPLGAPVLTLLPGTQRYPFRLEQDFVYCWPGVKDKWPAMDVCVPRGYLTDLLSIPRLLWPVLSPFGAGCWGALPHDILYSAEAVERAMADQILYDAAVDSGASRGRAWVLYRGVRLGGGCTWKAHKPEDVSDDLQALVEATERWQQKKVLLSM